MKRDAQQDASDMTNLLQSRQVVVASAAFALAAVCYQYSELMGVGASGTRDKSMVSRALTGMCLLPVIHQPSIHTCLSVCPVA